MGSIIGSLGIHCRDLPIAPPLNQLEAGAAPYRPFENSLLVGSDHRRAGNKAELTDSLESASEANGSNFSKAAWRLEKDWNVLSSILLTGLVTTKMVTFC